MSRWGSGLWRGLALSTSTSMVALLAAGAFSDALAATAAQQLSTGGLGAVARAMRSATTGSPTASAAVQAQIALSAANLARAAQALSTVNNQQAAAMTAAQKASEVLFKGATPLSGLQCSPQCDPATLDPSQWINLQGVQAADRDTASETLTIHQTAKNAVATWSKFNLAYGETLAFDQQGNANWTVLNRVTDVAPSQIFGAIKAPGSVYVINRNGIVFHGSAQINVHSLIASSLDIGAPNMTTDARNTFFINQGIINNSNDNIASSAQASPTIDFSYRTDDPAVEGNVTVEAGATINAFANSDGGGFVYLFAPQVSNAGTISTQAGETLMVAAQQISLTPHIYTLNTLNPIIANVSNGFSGVNAIAIRDVGVQFATNPPSGTNGQQDSRWNTGVATVTGSAATGPEITVPGQVTNTGFINADQGTVILNGDSVWQGGVVQANTGTGRNGSIFLDAMLQTTLTSSSATLSLPSEGGAPIALRAITSFVPGSIEVSGNTIDLEGQIEGPGANVTVTGTPTPEAVYPSTLAPFIATRDPTQAIINPLTQDGLTIAPFLADGKTRNPAFVVDDRQFPRIDVGSGAIIDVSGLDGVTRSVADNFVTVTANGNEFADQPLQRSGALFDTSLTFDIRQPTALIDVSDAAGNVPQTIDELLTGGGMVKLSAQQNGAGSNNKGGEVILQQGSVVNVSGGYTQYTGAYVSSTNLVTSDGRVVNIGSASPLDTYVGVAGVVTVDHAKWNLSQTFVVPLLSGSTHFEPGYVEGRDAGGISIDSSTRIVDSTIVAGVVAGERQKELGQISSFQSTNSDDLRPVQLQLTITSPSGQITQQGQYNPYAMPSAGYLTIRDTGNTTGDDVVIEQNVAAQTDPSFNVNTPLSGVTTTDIMIAPSQLSASALAGLSQVSINVAGTGDGKGSSIQVAAGTDLTVQPGGIIKLFGSSIAIFGDLTARAGQIIAEAGDTVAGSSLAISAQSVLDASGLWVNDAGLGPGDITGGAYVNGGSITLLTDNWSTNISSNPLVADVIDRTGNIVFDAITAADGNTQHTVLDVSSGGRVTQSGSFQPGANGTPAGNGGNVTIETYAKAKYTVGNTAPGSTTDQLTAGSPPVATIEVRATDAQGNVTTDATLPDGYIDAFGFAQGGSFTGQAAGIQIGGSHTSGTQNGTFYLPSSFFAGAGFSSYNLTAWASGLAVESDSVQGSVLRLEQRNFVADPALINLATGAHLAAVAALDYLPDIIRTPVNLTLSAYTESYPFANSGGTAPPQADLASAYPGLDRQPDLLIDSGVEILADPRATIALNVAGRGADPGNPSDAIKTTFPAQAGLALVLGDIRAPGGTIDISQTSGSEASTGVPGEVEVWLGPQSTLDVSGTAIVDTRQSLFRAGQVIAGGAVTVNLNASNGESVFVAQPGALIDVSGASGTFDILQPGGGDVPLATTNRAPTEVWSDAGAIALYAPTLLFDGTYRAQPGDSRGNGGSLTLAPVGANSELDIQQSGAIFPVGLAPDAAIAANVVGHGYLMADQLAESGIQNLTLSPTTNATSAAAAAANGDDPTNLNYAPGNIVFTGNTTLTMSGNLEIDAAQIQLGNAQQPNDVAVTLEGGYVALRNYSKTISSGNPATLGALSSVGNNLIVSGNTIDIAGGLLTQVNEADFSATGDIRLRVPYAEAATAALNNGNEFFGELATSGKLKLTAAQIYPVSNVDFTLKSLGAISFATATNSTASTPLSAGGTLRIDAQTIDQNGRLLAPLGTILLGAQSSSDLYSSCNGTTCFVDPYQAVQTTTVTLDAGSITSVSLAGMTVPFGETTDGKNWTYDSYPANSIPGSSSQITLPTKEIVLSAPTIEVTSGAKVDLSGGGDVVASEFVPGTGGNNDALTNNFNTAGATFNPNVYAVIPGYNPAVAPVDYDMVFVHGNAVPAIGRSVFLSGGKGLPAGYYTLLPPDYAVLPGAYRVTVVANSQDALAANNRVLQDGTMQMAGYFAQPGLGTRDSRTTLFDVQNAATWRLYSEIDQTSGNAFFAAQAASAGTVAPRLPVDAGHFVANVSAALDLSGQFLLGAAPGGRGAQVDIAAQQIEILAANGSSAAPGFVGIAADQLTALGASTLMLGGVHATDDSGNAVIVPVASKIEIANDAASPLDASELILVDASGANNAIQLDSGSVIGTTGVAVDDGLTAVTIGGTVKKQAISGDGALLAVSDGAPLTVARNNPSASPTGTISVKGGATINGGNALTLDATQTISLAEAATFGATNITLSTQNINIGTTAATTNGLSVAANGNVLAQLEAAQGLTLRAANAINFYTGTPVGIALTRHTDSPQTPDIDSQLTLDAPTIAALDANGNTTGTGNTVTLSADNIALINSNGVAGQAGLASVAALQVNAETITLGNQNATASTPSQAQALSNFTTVTFAAEQIATRGVAAADANGANTLINAGAAALTFTTPGLLVGAGAQGAITTTGAVSLAAAGAVGAPVTTAELSGTLSITGGSISENTLIQANSGEVDLHATSGDVTLGSNAVIDVAGYAQTFFDQVRISGGGIVQLTSDNGNLNAATGARIDVSSPAGFPGYAGTVVLTATAKGTSVAAGTVITDANGNLLPQYGSYIGFFENAVSFTTLSGTVIPAGTVITDANGNLLPAFASYVGKRENATAFATAGNFNFNTSGVDASGKLFSTDPLAFDPSIFANPIAGDGGGKLMVNVNTLAGNASATTFSAVAAPSLFSDTVNIEVAQGSLTLASAGDLRAQNVTLAADTGTISIGTGQTIDASGAKGGTIDLFGGQGVTLNGGQLLATASDASQQGGEVEIGTYIPQTSTSTNNGSTTPGYIDLASGTINVSNLANAAQQGDGSINGGIVHLRAPLIDASGNVIQNANGAGANVAIMPVSAIIKGATNIIVEAFEVFTPENSAFDGIVDPSGGYDSSGNAVANIGSTQAQVAATAVHKTFYQTTLVNFVEGFSLADQSKFSSLDKSVLNLQPGIDLVNDSKTHNNGNITVTDTWNLGAGYATNIVNGSGAVTISSTTSVAVGRVITDASGNLLPVYANYTKAAAGAAFLENTQAITIATNTNVPVGTVITDASGNLLAPYANYVGVRENAKAFTDLNGTTHPASTAVITDAKGNLLAPFTNYTGYEENKTAFAASGGTLAAGSVITDATGSLLSFYNGQNPTSYKYSGYFENGTAFEPTGGLLATAGQVLSDANGNVPLYYASGGAEPVFVPGSSAISKLYYRTDGGSVTGEAPDLTIRTGGALNVNASITDGFFETQNRLDTSYLSALGAWVNAHNATSLASLIDGPYLLAGGTPGTTLPVAPYDSSGNGISPLAAQLATADLFPLLPGKGAIGAADGTTGYGAINSSSYTLVGGANFGSADPAAVQPLSVFTVVTNTTHQGDIVVTGDTSVLTTVPGFSVSATAHLPTYVRTGTGSITVAAARDLYLKDPTGADALSRGVIYSAGRNSLPTAYTVNTNTPTGQMYMAPAPLQGSDFQVPLLMACSQNSGAAFCASDGPLTAAAYPVNGGNVTIAAQRDIVGTEGSGATNANDQEFLAPWMVSQGSVLQNPTSGLYSFASTGNKYTPAQASWWINFGSFDQGVMSVGGDVRVTAGRDINQLSVSLPTTAWTSGGRTGTSVPILNPNPSGDMEVSAGRDILSGFYYEGSRTGTITAGGKVASDFTANTKQGSSSTAPVHVSTLLALDTGTIAVTARDSIDIAGIVSGASTQSVSNSPPTSLPVFLSSYGPTSAVTLEAISGNIVTNSLTHPIVLAHGSQSSGSPLGGVPIFGPYPASFEATALLGNVTVASGFQMAPSNSGTLTLLAQGSLTTIETDSTTVNANAPLLDIMNAGPSLIEQSFNPSSPAAGFGPDDPTSSITDLGPELLHQDDPNPDLFYAVNGDITSLPSFKSTAGVVTAPMAWEVDKPAKIHAGQDVIDLPFFGENLSSGDVTSVIAGRDITYTDNSKFDVAKPLSATEPGNLSAQGATQAGAIQAGLSLAGPGFFDIEAGRNLGPFVTPGADSYAASQNNGTDAIGNGIITFGNTYTVGNRLMESTGEAPSNNAISTLSNPFASEPDFLLPREGASIIANFGVGKGINYAGVINAYLNPNPPAGVTPAATNYLPQLQTFLQTLGMITASTDAAWTAFQDLPLALQYVFVDKIFAAELANAEAQAATEKSAAYPLGYSVIAALFPASLGYTDNGGGGPNSLSRAATGDLDMLHATIKTTEGGDVSIFGPGGGMNIGSTAEEIDSVQALTTHGLTLSALGILTLDGGTISTFTDGNVFVDQSRVLTILGGDVDMWSSNGDLDAGRGKRTTADFTPLTVSFSPDDYQTVNPNGLVTGAGIGTIQGTPAAPKSQVNLLAPRGTINFGAAGVRSTGNLNVSALSIVNAANASVSGTTTGVPTAISVNLGALESASSAAGGAAQAAQSAAAAASNRNTAPTQALPSQISVQVLGYGNCDKSCTDAAGGSAP